MERALKVCVAGLAGSGKTYLCRLLGGQAAPEGGAYAATVCVRIQMDHTFKAMKVPVDLWDCAGGEENLRCANMLSVGIDTLVLVYDAAQDAAQEKELECAFQRRMAADMARSLIARDKVYRLKRSHWATQEGAGRLEGSL